MYEQKRELFKKDFDDELRKALGKPKEKRPGQPVSPVDQDTEKEKFAVQMGIHEIESISQAIQEFTDKAKDCIVASQILNELSQFEEGLEYTRRVLCWDFNPLTLIAKEGPNSYRNLLYFRKQLITDLLNKYDRGYFTEEDSN